MNAIPRTINVSNPDDLRRLSAQATMHGAGHVAELILAAARWEINLAFIPPGARLDMQLVRRSKLPPLVVIGDDYTASPGPAGFHNVPELLRWAPFVALHASGGTVADYRNFLLITRQRRGLLLIETTTGHAPAWNGLLSLARGGPDLVIWPREGAHPIEGGRA